MHPSRSSHRRDVIHVTDKPETMKPLTPTTSSVWVSHPSHGFLKGTISDLQSQTLTVQLIDTKARNLKDVTVPYDSVFPAEENDPGHQDNCSLMYLNEATLLNNVKVRWDKGEIYSYIANMLIALNPYNPIPNLYNAETIKKYQSKSLGTLPPHVFAIGDKSYRDMKTTKTSQSIIVSGESGAGKTESTKYILKFLCGSWGNNGLIEQRILEANVILEAFGNAKTTRNNNSSRFGKFIEIHFDDKYRVGGGYISHYLLEKSRIPTQTPSERSYHIFYQLLSGLDSSQKSELSLNAPIQSFNFLKNGTCEFFGEKLKDPIVHDLKGFENLNKSFANLGIKNTSEIYKIVAIVLHLGNIEFQEDQELTSKGGCIVEENESLQIVVKLTGIEEQELKKSLTSRIMQTAKGGSKGTIILVPLKKYEAIKARDALAKAIYSRLFDYIVASINGSIPFEKEKSHKYIGVLDIAGFEYFKLNSFEQFCINYCNEKLQQFFNERVLRDEQELYEKEGLNVKKIEYLDNLDCLELIEGRPGILSLLDEEGKLPKSSFKHFTQQVHNTFVGHFRLELPRKSRIKEHRELLDDEGFTIRHFAGAVCYDSREFLDKNNDNLHFGLEVLVQNAGNSFLKGLFGDIGGYSGKLGWVSVAGKFRGELGELVEKLRSGGTSFVRCVKPNGKMVGGVFEGGLILSQLQCAGMSSVLELMQGGFPSRVGFSSLYQSYASLLPPKLSKLDPRFFCRALFKAVGLHEEDFKFGLTKVFFRPGKFKEFDQLLKSDKDELLRMVANVMKWIIVSKWKRVIYSTWAAIKLTKKIQYRRQALIQIQKNARMYLTRKRHRPRYLAILQLKKLLEKIQECEGSVKKLKNGSQLSQTVATVKGFCTDSIKSIKTDPTIPKEKIQKLLQESLEKTEKLAQLTREKIQEERNAEELAKAEKLKKAMEDEKRMKEEEEERLKMEEQRRKEKATIEAKRLEQEKILQKLEQTASTKITHKTPKLEEQEKRDEEIAQRLAQEGAGTLEGSSSESLRRSEFYNKIKDKKFDLGSWKYSELRDCINTSCDVELLEACREEFHRRLKVYHAWKAKNGAKNTERKLERAPKSVYDYSKEHLVTGVESKGSRYFRVPFGGFEDGSKGLWYAHFEGEFVVRQMEVSGGSGKCFVAGQDDMQMCELKLSETGLTRKRGAEILEYEFSKEWARFT